MTRMSVYVVASPEGVLNIGQFVWSWEGVHLSIGQYVRPPTHNTRVSDVVASPEGVLLNIEQFVRSCKGILLNNGQLVWSSEGVLLNIGQFTGPPYTQLTVQQWQGSY
jgi:hypothetical protein